MLYFSLFLQALLKEQVTMSGIVNQLASQPRRWFWPPQLMFNYDPHMLHTDSIAGHEALSPRLLC